MKKILKLNAIIAVIICSVLVFFTYKNNNTEYWNDWGNAPNAKEVYLRNTKIRGEELYSILTAIAKDENVNIVKTDYITKNKKTKLVKSVYIQDKTDNLFKENTMLKGSVLTMEDIHKNLYISTSMDKSTENKGQIFDLFRDDEVEIWTLFRLKAERGSLDGDYTIRSSKQENVDNFMKALATRMGISVADLTRKTTYKAAFGSPIENMSVLALSICFVLFALLSVYYAVNNSKKIGVLKLNGHANIDIWKSMVGSIVSIMLFSALILDLCILFFIKGITRDFLLGMGSIQIVLICLFLMLSLLVYVIIRRNTIGNLVKNKKPIRMVLGMTYVVKNILFMVLIGCIIIIANIFIEVNKEFVKLAQWRDVGDLAVLVNSDIGEDKESIVQGKTKLNDDFAQYYTALNKEGTALLAFLSNFTPHRQFKTEVNEKTGELGYVSYFDPNVVPVNYSQETFHINPNYLDTYPMYDLEGKKINLTDRDVRTILIPETIKDQKDNLISLYKSAYIDQILSDQRRHGEQATQIPKVHVNAIIYKADKKGYFTFNSAYESTNYMVYSPIFVVLTETSMTRLEKSQMRISGLDAPVKLKLNGKDSTSYNESNTGILQKYELFDNNLKFMTINEVFGTQIESLNNAIKQFTIAMFISFLVMVLMTLQLSQMLLEIRKKKYCIQKLYGYKFLNRYQHILILNIGLGSLVSVIAILIIKSSFASPLSFLSYIVGLPFIFIDILLTMAMLRYYENKNVSKMMKGE